MDTVAEIFDKIMAAKQWNKKQLAKYMGIDATILSQKLGAEWNHHWRVFVRLLPLMVELEIIGHEELYGTTDKNGRDNDTGLAANGLKSQENLPKNPSKSNDIMLSLIGLPFILQ